MADLLNKELGYSYNESKYRKSYQSFENMFDANKDLILDNDAYMLEMRKAKQDLEKEKVKYRDERNELSRLLRNESRLEAKFELLEDYIKNSGKQELSPTLPKSFTSDNDMLICLSDFHIGANYTSPFGCYDTDIAKDRLNQYLGKVIEIQKLYNSEKCYVALLGDMISGNIHKTIQVSNRENVIEQTQICSELIASFVYELSKHFSMVYISSVNGNHTRLDRKEDAVKDERMDSFIPWYIKAKTGHIKNIHVIETKIDSTIATLTIRDKAIIQVHGDYDSFTKRGAANLTLMLGIKPFAILFGHTHTCGVEDISGIKLIRSGCLGGSGDDYTIEKRLYSEPSQMCCVINSKGIVAYYPIEFE